MKTKKLKVINKLDKIDAMLDYIFLSNCLLKTAVIYFQNLKRNGKSLYKNWV